MGGVCFWNEVIGYFIFGGRVSYRPGESKIPKKKKQNEIKKLAPIYIIFK